MLKSISTFVIPVAISICASASQSETLRLECEAVSAHNFKGEVAIDQGPNHTAVVDADLQLNSVNQPTLWYDDKNMTGEVTVIPAGQLTVDEATLISVNADPAKPKASLRIILGLDRSNAKFISNGIVYEAFCESK